jgi:hypothetical protein
MNAVTASGITTDRRYDLPESRALANGDVRVPPIALTSYWPLGGGGGRMSPRRGGGNACSPSTAFQYRRRPHARPDRGGSRQVERGTKHRGASPGPAPSKFMEPPARVLHSLAGCNWHPKLCVKCTGHRPAKARHHNDQYRPEDAAEPSHRRTAHRRTNGRVASVRAPAATEVSNFAQTQFNEG